MSDDLEMRFTTALLDAVAECKRIGYNPTYFTPMLAELGGVETARHLITAGLVSDGFTRLWELCRLDLTVEAIALRSDFSGLFTRGELDAARRRLREFGFEPPS